MSRYIRFFAFVLAGLSILAPAAAEARSQACVSSAEKQALDTRVLQTELMIAGLSCGLSNQYNSFVANFRPHLRQQGTTLSDLFDRLHGRSSPRRLNTFVTDLANNASKRSQLIGYGYCHFVRDVFVDAAQTPPGDLERLTGRAWISMRHGYRVCGSS